MPFGRFDDAALAMHPVVDFDGASLAMYPSVGFASQAQGYVSKERRFLSDAPFGRLSESPARRLPKIRGGIFPSFSF